MFEEVHLCVLIGGDGFVAGVPAGRADLSVLVSKLESFDESEGLIDTPSNGIVVDLDRPYLLRRVDNE